MSMEQLKRWYEDRMNMESSVLDSINEANRDSGVSPMPDNGFVNYRKVTEVEKVKIMYILQDAAHKYITGSESRRSPGDVVSHLLKSGAPVEALCVVMELRPEEVYNLADNRMHSYVLNSYKRIFGNLEEHMATRKYTRVGNLTGEDIERMDLDAQGQDCMRDLYEKVPQGLQDVRGGRQVPDRQGHEARVHSAYTPYVRQRGQAPGGQEGQDDQALQGDRQPDTQDGLQGVNIHRLFSYI